MNKMGEICMATPAISEGVLYFRSLTVVYWRKTRNAMERKLI
jgi:hypothetical protein